MKNETILDFSKNDYSDATVCDETNLIHKSKMQEILNVWHKLYQQCEDRNILLENDTDEVQSVHNTISIFASRGAGKTTFLLSFLKRIKDEDKKSEVLFLNRIDPTHIENKQHTFINVLASIQNSINELDNNRNKGCVNRQYSEQRLQLKEYYTQILKALPFIDGIGKKDIYDEWEDEEYISLNGMDRANASNNLERNFHLYIQTALKYLDKKCIVIPFDDIDTDFQKGFEILEVIRKYLTTPQIITIITGDLELYSKLVRRAKWVYFNKEFLRKETIYSKHSKEEFSDMIDQLENQYLMKILKPENRILINTIKEYVEDQNLVIKVKFKEDDEAVHLKIYYKELIKHWGFNDKDESLMNQLLFFLMDLSLRAQIQLLTLMKDLINNEKLDVTSGLLNVFWNDINQTANHPKKLLRKNELYSVDMLQYLVDTKRLYTNSNFLPEADNRIVNKALLAIGARFNQLLTKHNHLMIDYWLRISYIQYTTDALKSDDKENLLNDFLNFIQFKSETSLHKMVGLGQAYCNCELNAKKNEKSTVQTLPGIIYIGDESPAVYGPYAILTNIPMIGTLNAFKQEFVFISIYRLLAVIKELLINFETDPNNINHFKSLISKYCQYRNFIEPNKYYINNLKNDSLYDVEYSSIINRNESIEDLYKQFITWQKSSVKVSTLLLNRIFTRFYYTMINIDGDKSYSNAAEKLNAYIIALWNAALVECEQENDSNTYLNLNNNRDIEDIFIDNYKEYIAKNSKHNKKANIDSVFKWLLESPILKLYINPFLLFLIEDLKSGNKTLYFKGLLRYDRIISSRKTLNLKIRTIMNRYDRYVKIQDWIDRYRELKNVERSIRVYEKELTELSKKKTNVDERDNLEKYIEERKNKELAIRSSLPNFRDAELNIEMLVNMSESSVKDIELEILNSMATLMDKRREYISKLDLLKSLEKKIATFVRGDYEKIKAERESYVNKTVYDYLSQYII